MLRYNYKSKSLQKYKFLKSNLNIFLPIFICFSLMNCYICKKNSDIYKIPEYKNKGNCYLVNNMLDKKFNLSEIPYYKLMMPEEETLYISFCSKHNLDDSYSNNAEKNNPLIKLEKDETNITLYDYSYETKRWDYLSEKDHQALVIRLDTRKECINKNDKKLTKKIYIRIKISKNASIIDPDLNKTSKNWKNFNNIDSACIWNLEFFSNIQYSDTGLELYRFYSEYPYIFGLGYIVIGFFLLSQGNLFESITFYVNGIIFCRMIILFIEDFIIYNVYPETYSKDFHYLFLWIGEFLTMILGLLLGQFIRQYKISKVIFMGAMTGHILSYLVWLPLSYFLCYKPFLSYFVFNIICFILTGFIACKLLKKSENFFIFSCAIMGSYCMVKVKF